MGIRIPSGSSNPISLAAVWQNIYEKSGTEFPTPSAFPASNLQTLSRNIASSSTFLRDEEVTQSIGDERHWIAGTSSSVQSAGNIAGTGHYYGMNELWGANYPTITVQNITFERGGAAETAFVDGETIQVEYNSDQSTAHTVGLYNDLTNVLVGSTFTNTTTSAGTGSWTTFNGNNLTGLEGAGASGEDYYFKFTINNFNNKLSQRFTHWDTVNVGTISKSPTGTQYVDNQHGTTAIDFSHNMTAGHPVVRAWVFTNASDGDNEKQNGYTSATITSAATAPTITYTGTGTFTADLTVTGNPTAARNADATGDDETVTINYNQSVIGTGWTNNDNINQGADKTIVSLSYGFSGTFNIGYDDNSTASDITLVGSTTEPVSTALKLETVIKTFTMNTAGTFFPKAYHAGDSSANVGATSIIVAPTFSYSVPANISINVSTTRVLDISSVVGNGASVVISSSPSAGSGTNTATLTPLLANDVYTITYDGAANYSQTQDYSRTVTVNPTVSVALSSDQGDYPITDENGNTITSAKHGISPTIFTATPTVIGTTQTTFLWTLTDLPLETSYTTATAGFVKFKMTDNGSVLRDLTVSGNSTSGTGTFTVTTQAITKSFDNQPVIDTTVTKLRRYSSYDIDFQCDYIKNVKLQRKNIANSAYYDLVGSTATSIGGDFVDEDVGPSFTIPSNATLSTGGRLMRLVDYNYTSLNSLDIKNSDNPQLTEFTIYDRLAAVPTGVTPASGNEIVSVTWTDGNSNSGGNKVYVYSDAGSTQVTNSPFTWTGNVNTYLYSYTLASGTSRVPIYFKVSGINASSEEGVISDLTSAAYVHPDCSYSTTGNTTITVGQTTDFTFTAISGYNFEGDITSSPNIGSADDISSTSTTVTMTPLVKNNVYTITYENVGADIGQTAVNQTNELIVNPTVSVALTDNQAGATSYPINDEHSNTITLATHGYNPTIFTATPTVVGINVDTYAWTLTGLPLESGSTTSTAGAVLFKMTNDGTASPTLEVSCTSNDTDATAGFSVTTASITKSFNDAVTSDKLRHGTTFTVSSIAVSYITRMEVWRQYDGNSNHVEQVCDVEVTAASIDFDLTGGIAPYDDTARHTYLKDADNGDIVTSLGDHKIWQELPIVDLFTATAASTLGGITLAWETSHAGTVGITVNTGTDPGNQSAMDGGYNASGLGNNAYREYTLTATNANGEQTTATAEARTIDPSVEVKSTAATSWTYGDIGAFNVRILKNFNDTLTVYMGEDLRVDAAGGTIYTTLSSQGAGSNDFNASFNKTNFGGTVFGAVVDFKAGSAASDWHMLDNAATFSDFDAPSVATGTNVSGETGNSLQVNWAWGAGAVDNLQISGSEHELGAGDPITSITNTNTTNYINVDLDSGTEYDYKIRKSRTEIAAGVARVKNTDTAIFSGTTVSWTSIQIDTTNIIFPVNGGSNGWSNPEEAFIGSSMFSSDGTLHYLTSPALGAGVVNMNKANSGGDWGGGNQWYRTTEEPSDVMRIDSGGDITQGGYYAADDVLPKTPNNINKTVNTTTSVTIGWNDMSDIEDNFYVYRIAGATAPTTSTYNAVYTVAANIESYTNTGLSAATQYTWAVYAKRGDTYSGGISITATTMTTPTVDTFTVEASSTNGQLDIEWETSNFTVGTVTLYRATNAYMYGQSQEFQSSAAARFDHIYPDTGLGDNTTRYYRLAVSANGVTVYSGTFGTGGTTNAASTSWTPPPNFSMEDNAFAHTYRNKYADVTNGSTSTTTTISATNGLTLKLSLTGYPTGTSGYTSSKNITIGTSNDRIYIRFKYIHPKDNASASSVVTFLNNSVSDTCTVDITTSGEI